MTGKEKELAWSLHCSGHTLTEIAAKMNVQVFMVRDAIREHWADDDRRESVSARLSGRGRRA